MVSTKRLTTFGVRNMGFAKRLFYWFLISLPAWGAAGCPELQAGSLNTTFRTLPGAGSANTAFKLHDRVALDLHKGNK